MAAIRANLNRHVEMAIDTGTIIALATQSVRKEWGAADGDLKIDAHPLGHKREAGPIKQPDPKCRPKKEKPSSPAPGAYDVNN